MKKFKLVFDELNQQKIVVQGRSLDFSLVFEASSKELAQSLANYAVAETIADAGRWHIEEVHEGR